MLLPTLIYDATRLEAFTTIPVLPQTQRVVYAMAGCFLPKPVASSNACAICRTLKSS
jgi:hypothetical protein